MAALKQGSHGAAVSDLQKTLNQQGFNLTVDGWYGTGTHQAVIDFQRRNGLVADGIAGPKTLQTLKNGRDPKLLTTHALQQAADHLGVPLAVVQAVNSVESRGTGFLPDGRPVILFERHIFYRQLKTAGADAAAISQKYPALCNPKRGGYVGGAGEWKRLNLAATLCPAASMAAIEAASWGLFQIMGFQWSVLGYESANTFAHDMHRSEAAQLGAFVRFIMIYANLHKALKARKWATFARLYNGPAYRDNLYDIKLARAYEQFNRGKA